MVWGFGYSDGGGLDGPCLGTGEWSSKHSFEGYGGESHTQLWPPGSVRCELHTPAGRIERVFPGTATYLVATLLALLPLALWQLARGSGAEAQIKRTRPG
jgi:hypothetical protein